MIAIYKKEIRLFFSSSIGYLVIGFFLILTGLFLWVFNSGFNMLNYGFANLIPFFNLSPWVLLFLVPAVCMRSFSEEKKQGTLELLLTKPISKTQLVLGKFLGALTLIIIALLPSILYVITVYYLGQPKGNLDIASIYGAYIGLALLVCSYVAISIFSSALTTNQIIAFIIAVTLCLLFYLGFEALYSILPQLSIEFLSINYHFKSLSRGVIDTRNIIYLLSLTALFITLTVTKINTFSK